jgi:hypothetical protein
VNLLSQQLVFKAPAHLNEIDLINRIHALRACAKQCDVTGVITYRADVLATQHEGRARRIQAFKEFVAQTHSILYQQSLPISSRRYANVHLNYVGDNLPIVNDPMIDWGIEDAKLPFPTDLMAKILDLSKAQTSRL